MTRGRVGFILPTRSCARGVAWGWSESTYTGLVVGWPRLVQGAEDASDRLASGNDCRGGSCRAGLACTVVGCGFAGGGAPAGEQP